MIGIHDGENEFEEKWIEYCERNNIKFKLVNCFDSDIIDQLKDCDGLLWNWPHTDLKAQQFARQLTYSLEEMGVKVFPDRRTCWHYDDKVGQKYLLESINAPLVPSYVFYNKKDALNWAKTTEYPKVFKTRNGAGSQNVRLIHSQKDAIKIIIKAFEKGIPGYDKFGMFRESLWKLQRDKSLEAVGRVFKYSIRLPLSSSLQPDHSFEKNYVYFQDFIPENDSDIRIIVIGDRAFAIKRMVRDGDFRASGSGKIVYEKVLIPEEAIQKTFELNYKLQTQSVAVDWVHNKDKNEYELVEISYAFARKGYLNCPGYWDSKLNWYEGKFYPEYFILEDFIYELKTNQ